MLRARTQFTLNHRAISADENWAAFVNMAEACCPLILTYKQGINSANIFSKSHGHFNKANSASQDYRDLTIWLLQWCFTIVTIAVMLVGGMSVRHHGLAVGNFVMLLN